MLVEVAVAGLALDPRTDSPILLLKDIGRDRVLPIWIGVAEASAIASQVEGVHLPRPMTHDLIQQLLLSLGGSISKVAITSLVEATFYANITLRHNDGESDIDARPSDAIAVALRSKAPIFVEESILDEGSALVVYNQDGALDEAAQQKAEDITASDILEMDEQERAFSVELEEIVNEFTQKTAVGAEEVRQTTAERWATLLRHFPAKGRADN